MTLPIGDGPGALRPARVDPADLRQLEESPVSARRLAGLFRSYRGPLLAVVAMIVVSSLVSIAQPFLVRAVIDNALPNRDLRLLVWLVVAMLGVAVAVQAIGVWQTLLSTRVGEGIMHDLRTRVFAHLQKQSLSFFTRNRGGEIQSRITSDVAGMQSVVTTTATSIASNVTTAIATAAAMVALSWQLALISLVVIPPAVLLTRQVALTRRDITTQRQRVMADLYSQVEDSLSVSGARLAKTLGTGDRDLARFDVTSRQLADLAVKSQLAGRWRMAVMQIAFAAIPAVIYLAAGLPITGDDMTIGTLVAFTALQTSIFRPLMGLLSSGAQWVASMALFSRVFGYLDLVPEVPEPEHPVAVDPAQVRGEVCFDDVHFRYPDADREALRGVSLTIPPGATLAVVGETGSGKSTLAALADRLHDPTSGVVTIDGLDLRRLSRRTLTTLVGVVSQETYLVHDTIRANLLAACPDATDEQLWQSLAWAEIDDLVRDLPDGLDTIVGARGHRFSGGEQQRLVIARTLLRNPRILILDEATSALDNRTEVDVQRHLDALSQGRTTLIIAHRLSTIRDADLIAVLAAGRLVELGRHDDLVRAGGPYAALLERRARDEQGPEAQPPAPDAS